MFYEDLKKLRPVEFKRYCGVKPKTFERTQRGQVLHRGIGQQGSLDAAKRNPGI